MQRNTDLCSGWVCEPEAQLVLSHLCGTSTCVVKAAAAERWWFRSVPMQLAAELSAQWPTYQCFLS